MKLFSLLAVVFALFFISAATAAETQPASPKETLIRILDAARTGDLEATLKFFCTETEKEKAAAEAMMLEVLPQAAVENAAVAKFGKDAIMDRNDGPQLEKEYGRVKAGVEKIDGDTAKIYLGHADGTPPEETSGKSDVQLKKVGGVWKLDATPSVSRVELGTLKRGHAIYKAALEVAADIKAGKFAGADEAFKAAEKKIREIEKSFESAEPDAPAAPPAASEAPAMQK